MTERDRKKIAVLERALHIAADGFAQLGYHALNGDTSPEAIVKDFVKMARWELKEEAAYLTAEAIKKHPRAL